MSFCLLQGGVILPAYCLYYSILKCYMAKTKTSNHGKKNKKIVTVKSYKKSNGKTVKAHRRSTPN